MELGLTGKTMKIVITGASGLLGHKIVNELKDTDNEIVAIYNRNKPPIEGRNIKWISIDLEDLVRLQDLILKIRPNAIIHAGSYTDVDGCELNKRHAWRVNVESTRTIAKISKVVNSYLIYISTDYVFDGSKGRYSEEDTPSPINYYGLTKLLGEEAVKSQDILYTIVRTSAIYGVGYGKVNFGKYIIEKLSRKESIKALKDQYVSPTLNTLLAKSIVELLEIRYPGTLHIAGERMSRYQFAKTVAERLGFDPGLVVEAYERDFKWVAPRPRDSSLDCGRARGVLKVDFYSTDRAMEVLREEYRSLEPG